DRPRPEAPARHSLSGSPGATPDGRNAPRPNAPRRKLVSPIRYLLASDLAGLSLDEICTAEINAYVEWRRSVGDQLLHPEGRAALPGEGGPGGRADHQQEPEVALRCTPPGKRRERDRQRAQDPLPAGGRRPRHRPAHRGAVPGADPRSRASPTP